MAHVGYVMFHCLQNNTGLRLQNCTGTGSSTSNFGRRPGAGVVLEELGAGGRGCEGDAGWASEESGREGRQTEASSTISCALKSGLGILVTVERVSGAVEEKWISL